MIHTPETLKASLIQKQPNLDFSQCQPYTVDDVIRPICPTHGAFTIRVRAVLYKKRGCQACSRDSYTANTVGFDSRLVDLPPHLKAVAEEIEKSRSDIGTRRAASSILSELLTLPHLERFDLTKLKITETSKISLVCVEHGRFARSMQTIRAGSGCTLCGIRGRYESRVALRAERFEKEAREIHGNKYEYEKTIYTGALNTVIITCRIHGDFTVLASNHLSKKQGCPYCSGAATCDKDYAKRVEEVSEGRVKIVSPCVSMRHKVEAKCTLCGRTWRTWPRGLLEGHGCNICARIGKSSGFDPSKPAKLYLIEFCLPNGTKVYKIGITTTRIQTRINTMSVAKDVAYSVVDLVTYKKGEEAMYIESELKNELAGYIYQGEPFTANGHTELFVIDPRLVMKDNPFTHKKECD